MTCQTDAIAQVMPIVALLAGTCINELGADAGVRAQRCRLTTQALSGHRCIVGGDVLQHHDACAVIPLYADSTGCLDQVHATGVLHIKRVTGERKSCSSVVYGHLPPGWVEEVNECSYLALDENLKRIRPAFTLRSSLLMMIL